MGSTRMPGKILRPIHNKTLLEHILFRISFLRRPATTVIATSDSEKDNVVEAFCQSNGTACFRGSESNVLDRYYRCAQHYGFNQIVRLTGDNPFTDIEELERLIELHINSGSDFSHSFASLPVGAGAEIFTFSALEKSFKEGAAPHHLEHVDEYMLENPSLFKTTVMKIDGPKRRPEIRLTVDTEEDYRKACFIVKHARHEFVTVEEAIELCSRYA